METPIVYLNPFTQRIEMMPVEMVNAYVDMTDLNMEAAAHAACVRDDEAATNLLLSVIDCAQPEIVMPIPEVVTTPA
jgi:hypothetical protein